MTYTEIELRTFFDGRWVDLLASKEIQMEMIKKLEPYQLGEKPFAIRIDGGARNGSIIRFNLAAFKRKRLEFSEMTNEDDQKGGFVNQYKKVDCDTPVIHHYQMWDSYKKMVVDCQCIGGQLEASSYQNPEYRFILDDGTDVSKKLGGYAALTVLLDYDGPTELKFTKKAKGQAAAEREAVMANVKKFVDQLGQTVEVGDTVMFTHKEYSSQCMTGAGIAFGTVSRYFPSGGVSVTTFEGKEVRIMAPYKDVMVKVDNKLSQRIAAKKLDA
jgi:hypothetical protein